MRDTGCTGRGHSLVYVSKRVSKPLVKVILHKGEQLELDLY